VDSLARHILGNGPNIHSGCGIGRSRGTKMSVYSGVEENFLASDWLLLQEFALQAQQNVEIHNVKPSRDNVIRIQESEKKRLDEKKNFENRTRLKDWMKR